MSYFIVTRVVQPLSGVSFEKKLVQLMTRSVESMCKSKFVSSVKGVIVAVKSLFEF